MPRSGKEARGSRVRDKRHPCFGSGNRIPEDNDAMPASAAYTICVEPATTAAAPAPILAALCGCSGAVSAATQATESGAALMRTAATRAIAQSRQRYIAYFTGATIASNAGAACAAATAASVCWCIGAGIAFWLQWLAG